jgi:hypothetical protein
VRNVWAWTFWAAMASAAEAFFFRADAQDKEALLECR